MKQLDHKLSAMILSDDKVEVKIEKEKIRLMEKINKALSKKKYSNFTQDEIAAAIGCSQPRVSNIKKFKTKVFSVERLLKICYTLKIHGV
ncbi:XRE family transcriptional regulator [Vibrio harveyi]|uniref:XRE family transcriptional regulator n=1 Tax=Vibrio harveyi TaxID=669 RepID=UPI0023809C77|nr:XRE family transcriptional regulator [Vibrio harveyi]